MNSDLVFTRSRWPPVCKGPYAYIMAAYEVPPSPDYIPGPEVPPSSDYILGLEEPQSPPPLDFVPEPIYPEYMPQEDERLLPARKWVDEDPEEDPADYPANRDDDDDEDGDEDEDEEEEEEEHPALADSVPPVHRMTARISIWDEPSISLPPRKEVERLLALTTPPPSPVTPLSSPLPQIPSPPPNSPTHIEIPKSCLPLRKRGAIDKIAPTTIEGVNQRVTDLATIVEEETTSMYGSIVTDRKRGLKMSHKGYLGTSMGAASMHVRDVMSFCYYGSGAECIDFRVTVSRSQETEGYRHRWSSFRGSMDPQKVRHSLMHQERLVAVPRFGYVVAMLCSCSDKTNYSSWASQPGNENTPAMIRAQTYTDLTDEEKIRESIDIKETNIVLQGLPQDIYNLVNHNEHAKQIWDRVKLLIQGSELSLQEFNTKFVNHLQPEWSKFVMDVKFAKDMHTTNFDHLYAHLRQHEAHANEVHLTRQRYPNQTALVANSSSCLNLTQYYPQLSPATQQYYSPPAPQCSYDAPMEGYLLESMAELEGKMIWYDPRGLRTSAWLWNLRDRIVDHLSDARNRSGLAESGMDWLSKKKFVIVCHEKVVRIPLEGDEILRVHGECTQGVVKIVEKNKITFTSLWKQETKMRRMEEL
ncbi:hypothetical protein Tco_0190294 [Tanacetum coccineum]